MENGGKFSVEAGKCGHREMYQALGVFGLLDFTMSRHVLAWHTF
jgi:hypothetical protein